MSRLRWCSTDGVTLMRTARREADKSGMYRLARIKRVVLGALLAGLWTSTQSMAAPVTLEYWIFSGDPYAKQLKILADEFSRTSSNIRVNVTEVPYGEMYDKLAVAVAGGSPPDVSQFEMSAVIEWAAGRNIFEPIDRLLPELNPHLFLPGPWSEVVYEGRPYALPWRTDVRGLYWNVQLLDQVGLDSVNGPRDLSELDRYAQKLTETREGQLVRLGFAPWYGNWGLPGWFYSYGGQVYDPLNKRATLDLPANVTALEWVRGYLERYGAAARSFASKFGGTDGAFFQGGLALLPESTSFLGRLALNAPDLNYMTGEVPHAPGGRNGTWTGGHAHIIPRGARHRDEAVSFLRFLMRPETQFQYYKTTSAIPVHVQALQRALADARDPRLRNLLQQLPVAHGRPPGWVAMLGYLSAAQTAVLDGRQSPRAALEAAQRQMEAVYTRIFPGR